MHTMLASRADTFNNVRRNTSDQKPDSHVKDEHGKDRETIERNFKILKKCQSELDCLIFEMLFIRELEPKLNKHSDSIRAKVLTLSIHF